MNLSLLYLQLKLIEFKHFFSVDLIFPYLEICLDAFCNSYSQFHYLPLLVTNASQYT